VDDLAEVLGLGGSEFEGHGGFLSRSFGDDDDEVLTGF
jgi:hypothetical protein